MSATDDLSGSEIQAKLRAFVAADPLRGWDDAWKASITPWDAGDVQPPLRDLLGSRELKLPTTGRALVPGCGKGYDAPFIAATTGLDTLAVDISPTAVKLAEESLAQLNLPSAVKVSFELKDFFSLGSSEENYDLIYDYTKINLQPSLMILLRRFFVCIPLSCRTKWGQLMSRMVKPGGYLVTLIFPIDPPRSYGPPYYVRPEHYVEVLGDGWEKVVDEVSEVSSATHKGRERLVVWKKL
ncbi:uncharacterized protein PHACADRAFT_181664 [Phanerochaete carnosa HHB-10118-sp]|uniref:Methyltransferase domain-containing protein n=1 Tax=Phanerochaete carnosa (strain HHB-10118-sp) TaxID=650164 RepID=K5WKK0_PHACS|nr:uncharacterized protein PHACADRAFT_181664 [Phanerochaete carnosa HHB-10118-sp]EKM59684.1 hypothetical protein PHACADRAFT_181664 [Phanerochaete carnosa HHB-10118-sp]